MAQSGINIRLYVGGSPVPFSPIPMELVSGKTYKLTTANSDKTIWRSPDERPTYSYMTTKGYKYQDLPFEKYSDLVPYLFVYDGGTTFAERVDPANILFVDFLSGRITFKSTYTPTGTIYVSSEYIPISSVSCSRNFSLDRSVELGEVHTWQTIEDDGDSKKRQSKLFTASGSIGGFYDTVTNFDTIFENADYLYLRVYPDIVNSPDNQINVKALIESDNISFDVDNPNEFDINYQAEDVSEVR